MKNLILLLFVIISTNLYSQIAFYDALLVSEWEKNNSIDYSVPVAFILNDSLKTTRRDTMRFLTKIDLFLGYDTITKQFASGAIKSPEHSMSLTNEEIKQLNLLNVFLNRPFDVKDALDFRIIRSALAKGEFLIKEISADTRSQVGFLPAFGAGLSSSLVSILGGWDKASQTKLYDGFTRYVADEFKEGASNAYLDLLEKYMNRIGEFKVLFPETFGNLRKYGPFEFSDFGNELKSTFDKDLKTMPGNLVAHIEDPSAMSGRFPGISFAFLDSATTTSIRGNNAYRWFKIGVDIGDKVTNGAHPVNIIEYLDRTYADNTQYGDLPTLFRALNLIQSNLRDTSKVINGQTDNVWINFEQLKLLKTPKEWKYFYAILYNQDTSLFSKIFSATPNDITNWETIFNERVQPIYSLLLEIQEFARSQNNEKRDVGRYASLIIESLGKLNVLTINNADVRQAIDIFENCKDVAVSIKEEKYGAVIEHLTEIIEIILDRVHGPGQLDENVGFAKFVSGFNKLGKFAVAIVNSENSEDLKEVIKQFAADPGSYEQKRSSVWGIAVNSFPGFYGGLEKIKGNDQKWKGNFGVSLPVGIELYSGISKNDSNLRYNIFVRGSQVKHLTGYTFSIFLQAVDLGAILNYRLTDTESELPDDIDFKDIFSPGIIVNVGFKNTPLTLSTGYQYTPKLRVIGGGLAPNADRILLKLSWDIPIIHIANRKPEEVSVRQ